MKKNVIFLMLTIPTLSFGVRTHLFPFHGPLFSRKPQPINLLEAIEKNSYSEVTQYLERRSERSEESPLTVTEIRNCLNTNLERQRTNLESHCGRASYTLTGSILSVFGAIVGPQFLFNNNDLSKDSLAGLGVANGIALTAGLWMLINGAKNSYNIRNYQEACSIKQLLIDNKVLASSDDTDEEV